MSTLFWSNCLESCNCSWLDNLRFDRENFKLAKSLLLLLFVIVEGNISTLDLIIISSCSFISIFNEGWDKDGGVTGALLVDNDVAPLLLDGLDTLSNASSTPKIEYSDLVSCLSNWNNLNAVTAWTFCFSTAMSSGIFICYKD